MKRSFERSYAALSELFAFLDVVLDESNLDESVSFAARLALEEVFTNIVKYSTSTANDVSVAINVEDGDLVLILEDAGADPFDPTRHPTPDLKTPLGERRPGGLGLHLVRHVVDSIEHAYVDGTNVVTLRIRTRRQDQYA